MEPVYCSFALSLFRLSECSYEARAGAVESTLITGTVQNQDLRRTGQVLVEVKNQEGTLVTTGVSNDAGEFTIPVPGDETYSVSAVQDTYRSEYIVLKITTEAPDPVTLTLSKTKEIALEVRSPLAPIQYKASSETHSISRKDIEYIAARQQCRVTGRAHHDSERRLWIAQASAYSAGSCEPPVPYRRCADPGYRVVHLLRCTFAAGMGTGRYHSRRHGSAVWK